MGISVMEWSEMPRGPFGYAANLPRLRRQCAAVTPRICRGYAADPLTTLEHPPSAQRWRGPLRSERLFGLCVSEPTDAGSFRLVVAYLIVTRSLAARPKTSGWYISSARVGGTTKVPRTVARASTLS